MSTYTQLLYHIVFSTYQRSPTLKENDRPELFAYIYGLLKKKNCHLYRINGMEDHIHIFTHVHPTLAVSDLIKDHRKIDFLEEYKLILNENGIDFDPKYLLWFFEICLGFEIQPRCGWEI